ncbi:hypothetical protein NCCP2495_33430 [Dietzia sp. NCCP-2495]|nr:hypothetical protein NCCP2495_33430 [Dietzia sp. NCCP-2495]
MDRLSEEGLSGIAAHNGVESFVECGVSVGHGTSGLCESVHDAYVVADPYVIAEEAAYCQKSEISDSGHSENSGI